MDHSILLILTTGLILIISVQIWFNNNNKKSNNNDELYVDDDSIYLNLSLPKSQWFNMGYWLNPEEEFPIAASRLARNLILKSKIKSGDKVIEVGFGNGDSVLLLVEEFKPSEILGFTSLESQCRTALKRVSLLPDSIRESTAIDLRTGDAATVLSSLPPSSVDHVLALDCAYHFNTRDKFIKSSHSVLNQSGTLSLTDLILTSPPSYLDFFFLRVIFYLAKVPSVNIMTQSEYIKRLEPYYQEIQFEDISSFVFPGFLNFLERRDKELGKKVFGKGWKGLMWYGWIVRWYSGVGGGKQKLSFVLVTGNKREFVEK